MPEPVVIIGPANGLAGPNAETAADSDEAAANDTGLPSQVSPGSGVAKILGMLSALAAIGRRLFGLVARGFLFVARGIMSVASSYPRHSLAATASIVILAAIWYTQMSPRNGVRAPVTTQIKGDSASGPAADSKNGNDPKADGKATTPSPATTASTDKTATAKPNEPVSANSEPSTAANGSAPAPGSNSDANPPLPALAAAPTEPKETGPAPGKDAGLPELATAGKTEPAPGPSAPTLLAGSLPEPALPAASPVASDDKASGDALKPAPAIEAPAPVAVMPLPNAQGEPASLPAPTSDLLQLASKLEPAVDQNKAAQASPVAGAADTKPNELPAPVAIKTAPELQNAPGPAQPPGPPSSTPEPTKIEPVQPEPPKSDAPKVQEPASKVQEPAPKPDAPEVPPSSLELAPPGGDAAAGGPARSISEGIGTKLGAATSGAKGAVSQIATPALAPLVGTAAAVAALENQKAKASNTDADSPKAVARPDQAPSKSQAKEEPASEGWVSVPNSGKVPVEGAAEVEVGNTATGTAGDGDALAPAPRDVRAHAAKDGSFEVESPRSRETPDLDQNSGRAAAGVSTAVEARSKSSAGRVDSVPHVVERNENFWTISRLYYSSGRYYRALWKANADTHPDIKKLKVNDVIVVPPVEDLDPAYIDPPRSRAPSDLSAIPRRQSGSLSGGKPRDIGGVADPAVSSSVASREAPFSTEPSTSEGVPVRRSSRTDPDLDLPTPEAAFRRAPTADRSGRRADRTLDDADIAREEPASATAARAGTASARRPVYKVRPFDTLRSIARDMLGDSHRASEIVDLNRDLIDDPSHLIVGQVLELPDDARTSVRR